jgi:hypothetical protein
MQAMEGGLMRSRLLGKESQYELPQLSIEGQDSAFNPSEVTTKKMLRRVLKTIELKDSERWADVISFNILAAFGMVELDPCQNFQFYNLRLADPAASCGPLY